MAESVTQSSVDQAEGLRTIFGAESSCVVCLASALDSDTTIHLGHGTAYALKNAGHKTLLIDEFGLSERRTMSGFLYPTRYDLAQAFSNGIDLLKVVRSIDEHLWYATATKMRAFKDRHLLKLPTLDERLLNAGLSMDYMLLATNDPNGNILAFYGRQIKRFVVCSPEHWRIINCRRINPDLNGSSGVSGAIKGLNRKCIERAVCVLGTLPA